MFRTCMKKLLQSKIIYSLLSLSMLVGVLILPNTSHVHANYFFSQDIAVGATGASVVELQRYLNASGFIVSATGAGSPGHETNYFGILTKEALQQFQKAHNIPETGSLDSITRSFIQFHQGNVFGATVQPVVWANMVNTTASANSLSATGGANTGAFDKGATTSQAITSGDGYFEFTKADANRSVTIGLNTDTSSTVSDTMAFGLDFYGTYVEVRE